MAAADTLLVVGIFGTAGAYITNFGGFKDWVDTQMGGGGGVFGDPGGTTGTKKTTTKPSVVPCPKQCAAKYPGRIPRVANNVCYCDPPKPKPAPIMTLAACNGQCASRYPGRVPRVTNNVCYCDVPKRPTNCTPCQTCFVPTGVGCACKLDPNKLTYADANCKSTCGGYSFWTNYPCGSQGARTQVTVRGSCTAARAAWLARYGCKSSFAYTHAYQAGNEALDKGLMQVPTIS